MRAVVQRVLSSHVEVEGRTVGQINHGFMVLLGVGQGDDEAAARYLADRVSGLRVFNDEAGKMNLSLTQVGGSILVVSQFTLYADCHRGRRPGFTGAAPPEIAKRVYDLFCDEIRNKSIPVALVFSRQI